MALLSRASLAPVAAIAGELKAVERSPTEVIRVPLPALNCQRHGTQVPTLQHLPRQETNLHPSSSSGLLPTYVLQPKLPLLYHLPYLFPLRLTINRMSPFFST
jgi:hypothetical protein